jgi:hypothetical protein
MKVLNSLLLEEDSKIEEICQLSKDEANLDCKIVESDEESDDIFGKDEDEQK